MNNNNIITSDIFQGQSAVVYGQGSTGGNVTGLSELGPTTGQLHVSYQSVQHIFSIEISKVENGYVVKKAGKTYVFTNKLDILSILN